MSEFRNNLSIPIFFIYLLMAIILQGCGGGGGSENSTPQVTLDSLSVTNVSSTLKVLDTVQLSVTGTFSDTSIQDLSSFVTWSVANNTILDVSTAGLVTALSAGMTNVIASSNGVSIQTNISVKALSTLSISPDSTTMAVNSTQPLNVTGQYSDNSTEAFDGLVTWESSNSGIASVSNAGEVLAVSVGTVSISASADSVTESVQVVVLPDLESLALSNVTSTLKIGETFQLSMTGLYSDTSTQDLTSGVTWGVVNDSIFSVSNAGLVTALTAGTSTLTATYGSLSVQQAISVKALADLSISPTSLTLAIASAQQLSTTGRYTDNSTEAFDGLVDWESSNSGVASVSNSGEVLAVSAGTITVTASEGAISSTLSVTVSPASVILQTIVLNSSNTQVASGLTAAFSAKGLYSDGSEQNLSNQVAWSVSDFSKASIDSETGLLTALQVGTASVIATKEGLTGTLLITISPATLSDIAITPSVISLPKGSSADVNVTAIFSDNSKQDVSDQVEWSNSNNLVASIEENSYTMLALAAGLTTLSASILDQQANLSVTVTDAELVSLSLSPVNASIPLGRSQQYSAQGTYTDGSVQDVNSQVTWLSSSESQVLISNTLSLKGLAESLALGSTTLSAVLGDVQQDTTLTIEDASLNSIEIQPSNQTVAKGTDAEVKAFGYYSDGSQIDLTSKVIWNTPNSSFIDVLSASSGVIHSINEGSALISAELEGVSSLANITVSLAALQSISISSAQTDVPSGMTQRLVATGAYSDTSTKDISQQVTWQINDVQLATISNNNSESGLLRALSPGQVTVTASLGVVSDQLNINVTNAVLTGIQVPSPGSQLNIKSSVLVTATASYSDLSTQDVSSQVNWLSSDVNVASIGNSAADKGVVKALSVGTINITASLNGISSSLVQLEVTVNPNLPKALNLSVQPNIILNNNNDAALVNLVLVPSVEGGVIADGTAVTLTIIEGNVSRIENLVTTNATVSYSLKSGFDGFISLSASASDFSVSSGVLSTDKLQNAIIFQAQSRSAFDSNTLREGSLFLVLLRNVSNRGFFFDGIAIVEGDPVSSSNLTQLPGSPVLDDAFLSDGLLEGGEASFFGYELDQDVTGSIFSLIFRFSDQESGSTFTTGSIFRFQE
ncbi:MAG: hypothetical protein ACJAS1_000253 [Oleiphilaceae bacterium]|jgi:uncharacterized protein YjdB